MSVLRFRSCWIEPLLEGSKTQTLRARVPAKWEVGDVVDAACRYDRPPFASLRLLAIDEVAIDELDELDAAREGAGNAAVLRENVRAVYPTATSLVRVRFELVEGSPTRARAAASSSASPR